MDRPSQTYVMATDTASGPSQAALLPPWLSNSGNAPSIRSPAPSVTLSLASAVAGVSPPAPWTQSQREVAELAEWCREVEEGHRAWVAHKKEAGWRLRRVEAQLEAERVRRRREKAAEVDAKVRALREEQQAALERIEAEYREQLAGLRRDAEAKEQKLAELWAAKHARLASFLEQMGCPPPPNAR